MQHSHTAAPTHASNSKSNGPHPSIPTGCSPVAGGGSAPPESSRLNLSSGASPLPQRGKPRTTSAYTRAAPATRQNVHAVNSAVKTARRILTFVCLGLVTTVSVAAVASCFRHPLGVHGYGADSAQGKFEGPTEPREGATYFRTRRTGVITETDAVIAVYLPQSPPTHQPVDRSQLPGWCVSALRPWTHGERPWPALDYGDWRVFIEAGWPMRALSYEFGPRNSFPKTTWNSSPVELHAGLELKRDGPDVFAIPYRPCWAGLVVNTALFAGTWFALSCCAGALRKIVRLRRDQCQACGYDRSGSPTNSPCPECGGT